MYASSSSHAVRTSRSRKMRQLPTAARRAVSRGSRNRDGVASLITSPRLSRRPRRPKSYHTGGALYSVPLRRLTGDLEGADLVQLEATEQHAAGKADHLELHRAERRIHQAQRERQLDRIARIDAADICGQDLAKAPGGGHLNARLTRGTGVILRKLESCDVHRAGDLEIRRSVNALPRADFVGAVGFSRRAVVNEITLGATSKASRLR